MFLTGDGWGMQGGAPNGLGGGANSGMSGGPPMGGGNNEGNQGNMSGSKTTTQVTIPKDVSTLGEIFLGSLHEMRCFLTAVVLVCSWLERLSAREAPESGKSDRIAVLGSL